ncbi:MAG: hypothetical protein OEX12_05830 [Gammaproteobacteria bacterium]|nr:hypothetical protein [Gammaproteobacteria bacterium]
MNKKKVINSKNKRVGLPVVGSIVWYLFLDHLDAPEWVWGAMGLLLGLFWVIALIDAFNCEELETFK